MPRGSSGGAHSVYQEVKGMRALGIPARVALVASAWKHARAAYPDAEEVFVPFRDAAELARLADADDVLVATHFRSVALVARLVGETGKLPAYYIQDYEPFFADEGSADDAEAHASYAAMAKGVCFAKTHWLCDLVAAAHGVPVAKVEPSLDHEVYRPGSAIRGEGGPVRVIAMVRPRTTRRQPVATAAVLERLAGELGDRVEIAVFGCEDRELARLAPGGGSGLRNLGVLTREGVARALAESDVFLDASFYQAFGRTALEAMACGCTCVVPSVGGVREFARHGENALLVDPADSETLFSTLVGLVSDRPRLERLRSSAARTAQGFSVTRAALSEYLLLEREYRLRVDASRGGARSLEPTAGEQA
jgi:glycosyltransferase involved in cell wall biosynthesis